jgi:spermidine/putrescine transport system permease protein
MKLLHRIYFEEFPFLLMCPALLWQFIFLYLPLGILFLYSILEYSPEKKFWVLTFDYYIRIFNSSYCNIIINSFLVALATALFCFIIAYPLAYFLVMKTKQKYRPLLLFSLILPSWTSLIVQVYAWLFLFNRDGFLAQFLYTTGILPRSVSLLNNFFSILVGMISVFLPFMILPIYTVMEKMDKTLLEVSADLWANRYETFKRVIFPLSLPGVYVGLILVFLPAFGEFAIPNLLGGSKLVFWGNLIVQKFSKSREWKAGAALVVIGVLISSLFMLFGLIVSKLMSSKKRVKNSISQN